MGKISDALERQQNERSIKAKMLQSETTTARDTSIVDGFDPKLIACTAPKSIDAESFKTLKAQILFRKDGSTPRIILVTSAFPGEGKTFVAANLAVTFAKGVNEHSLFVDCDFHHPDAHRMLGYSNRVGLQDYLSGKMELSELLIRTKIDKLSLLTAGSPTPNPSELLSSTMMKEFFKEVKERYQDRYVVVDCAPSHIMAEVSVLANYVDSVIFVVMAHKTSKAVIRECIEKLGKEKIIGIVFNRHDRVNETYYKKYYQKK